MTFSVLPDRFLLEANLGSTCQLTSIVGHSWPMRVPVCLNFAKVSSTFCVAVPLLFLLYAIDMSKCCSILEFHLFADYTNLSLYGTSLVNLESKIDTE